MRINQKAITCNKYDEDSSILEQKLSKNCKLMRLETSTIGKLFSEGVEKTMSHYIYSSTDVIHHRSQATSSDTGIDTRTTLI